MLKELAIKILNRIKFIRSEPNYREKIKQLQLSNKKMILLGTPIHGNIGDHLIAEAEKRILIERFPDYQYIECTMPFSKYYLNDILKSVHIDDIVFISGGGWLGSEWPINELFVREIVKKADQCRLVILPQTVFYKEYDKFAQSGRDIYINNNNLIFCLREKYSLTFLEHYYKDNSKLILIPDFALFYHCQARHEYREFGNIKYCFRDDIEIVLNTEDHIMIERTIKKYDPQPLSVSTNTNGILIKPSDRVDVVESKIREIAESRLLITDRLHAMVMAAISGTPCIAFDNGTHKVKGVYDWLKDLGYIRLCSDISHLDDLIIDLLNLKDSNGYPSNYLYEYVDKLINVINTEAE